jgi:hypothetical protein
MAVEKTKAFLASLAFVFPQPSFDFIFPLATMPKIFCHALRARTFLVLFFSLRGQGQKLTQKKSARTASGRP